MLPRHPLHPALVHFPVALWLAAAATDGLWLATGDAAWASLSRPALAAGTATGALALLAGALELVLRRIPREAIGALTAHIGCMLTALTCCGASLALRREGPVPAALALSFAGAGAVVIGGWFGGTLVYRFGIGGIATQR